MPTANQSKIRNFCTIARVDHGKPTLANRTIERTGLLASREIQGRVLDNIDLEHRRGIIIRSQAVRTAYRAQDGDGRIFNLIDTPGHVDFNYEVSRSLVVCNGTILVVDAPQGIEIQTLVDVYLVLDHNPDVFSVINKTNLSSAEPERVAAETKDVISPDTSDAPHISARTSVNVEEVLKAIVHKMPAPRGDPKALLKALIFDSIYNSYKGVVIFCRIMKGTIKRGTPIRIMATGFEEDVVEMGYFGVGQFTPYDEPRADTVGHIMASIKNVWDTRVGDMTTSKDNPCASPLPGYKKVTPMVYYGLYSTGGAKYNGLRDALEESQLNDVSLFYELEISIALGLGLCCGFLGLLRLEIIEERLKREYNLDLVTTTLSVVHRVHKIAGEIVELTNPSNLPDPTEIKYMEKLIVSAKVMVIMESVDPIMTLCQEHKGNYPGMEYIETTRALLKHELLLNEIIYDFLDVLRSRSRGYASFDYKLRGHECSSLVKPDILVDRERMDTLSFIVYADSAYERGRKMCEKLKNEIPRHLFEIPIRTAIGGKITAREAVKAVREDAPAKCYGGDVSRKRKLPEKRKKGKKRIRQIRSIEIPQKTFMNVFKLDDE